MAQYKTGTVSVTNGSATVTGSGTLWSGEIAAGDLFTIVGDNAWYEVASVGSNTSITLSANYAGTTGSGKSYAISRDFTTRLALPYPQKGDIETASIIKRAFEQIDTETNIATANYSATTAPTANDDSGDGYSIGSWWVNVTSDEAYLCVDSTVGAAVWTKISVDVPSEIVSLLNNQSLTLGTSTIEGLTIGKGAGAVSTNTAVGASALAANTTGNGATAVGASALAGVNTSSYATAVGYNALNANTSGEANAAFGAYSLFKTTSGAYNTGAGVGALQNNTTASNNTAVGYVAGYSNTTGQYNSLFGQNAGYTNQTGSYNTIIGRDAGSSLTTSSNTLIGAGAGSDISSGSKNTVLGRYNGNQGGLDIRTASNYIVLSDGDGNPRIYHNGTTPYITQMSAGAGTNAVKFNSTNGAITYDTSSARYKDNIRDSIYGLSHVMQMRSAQFEYKDTGNSDVGLIAEELDPIIPELVGKNKDGEPDSVSYDRMVSVLVKAIQELKSELDSVKAELATLKGA